MKYLYYINKKFRPIFYDFFRSLRRIFFILHSNFFVIASNGSMLSLAGIVSDFDQHSFPFYLRDAESSNIRKTYRMGQAGNRVNLDRKEAEKIFTDNGLEFNGENTNLLIDHPPEMPPFPIIILLAALIKDILDVDMDLSLVGSFFTFITTFILSIILFLWCLNKTTMLESWWKTSLIKWLWRALILDLVIEYSPWFNIIPANTIFILLVYYREKKLVEALNEALKKLHHLKRAWEYGAYIFK